MNLACLSIELNLYDNKKSQLMKGNGFRTHAFFTLIFGQCNLF